MFYITFLIQESGVDFMKNRNSIIKTKIDQLKRKNVFWALLFGDWKMQIGVIIVLFFVFLATIGPLIFPLDLTTDYENRFKAPSFEHILGTDFAGRDTWAMLVHGSRDVMITAAMAGVFTVLIALFIGSIAGFVGGITDIILMRITDVFLTIPSFPVMMILGATLRVNNPFSIGFILSIWSWAGLARGIRSKILSLKESEFILAAKMLNLPTRHIIIHELAPSLMSYILVNFIRIMRGALTASVGLMFLGIIPYAPTNWGMMFNLAIFQTGAIYVPQGIWYLLAPMGAIILFQYGTLMLANSLEEIFNPRLRENE